MSIFRISIFIMSVGEYWWMAQMKFTIKVLPKLKGVHVSVHALVNFLTKCSHTQVIAVAVARVKWKHLFLAKQKMCRCHSK